MKPADVSIIIPTLNEAEGIRRAIESAWRAGAGEVVVSDGGSRDATCDIAREHSARVVDAPAGRGRQLRAGAESAARQVLLFLHADNELAADCLEQLCELIQRSDAPQRVWGAYRQRIDADGVLYRWLEQGNAGRVRLRGMPFGDQGIFCTRELYDQAGGYESVPLMEDVKFAQRLRQIRWPVLLEGPLTVGARRWQRRGVIRQTARNWFIQLAHAAGVSEERLATWYR